MADMKETYTLMFTDYPDIVNLTQMRKMLGGISNTLAYRMLREKKIKSKKVGREYKIPKVNVIKYVMTEQ
ncbi:MAG: DNA-binding protein [Clostridia bacterium]